MPKFTNIGYVSETKKSKEGESEKTFMLTVKPADKALASVALPVGSRILLKKPKQSPKMSDDKFEELTSWMLFEAVLVEDE
jgi:hypothetical protein